MGATTFSLTGELASTAEGATPLSHMTSYGIPTMVVEYNVNLPNGIFAAQLSVQPIIVTGTLNALVSAEFNAPQLSIQPTIAVGILDALVSAKFNAPQLYIQPTIAVGILDALVSAEFNAPQLYIQPVIAAGDLDALSSAMFSAPKLQLVLVISVGELFPKKRVARLVTIQKPLTYSSVLIPDNSVITQVATNEAFTNIIYISPT